jgi:hypothetical protein
MMFWGREAILLVVFGVASLVMGLVILWRTLRRAISRLLASQHGR